MVLSKKETDLVVARIKFGIWNFWNLENLENYSGKKVTNLKSNNFA